MNNSIRVPLQMPSRDAQEASYSLGGKCLISGVCSLFSCDSDVSLGKMHHVRGKICLSLF